MAAETGAAVGAAMKFGLLGKLTALFGAGAVGAALMALVEPPKTRRALFAQALAAGTMALIFTPGAVRALVAVGWVDLAGAGIEEWGEVALPCGFLIGALSWGVIGALVRLRSILRDRGGDALAHRIGIDTPEGESNA